MADLEEGIGTAGRQSLGNIGAHPREDLVVHQDISLDLLGYILDLAWVGQVQSFSALL